MKSLIFLILCVIIKIISEEKFIIERLRTILSSQNQKKLVFTIKKIILPIFVLMGFLLVNFYYFYDYYIKKGISFTNEDKFLFVLFIVSLIIMIGFYLFLIFDRAKLIKIINKLKREIIEVEDNCILVSRDTQEMILNYLGED